MLDEEEIFLRDGYFLGTRVSYGNKVIVPFWRVLGVEFTTISEFSLGSINASSSSGWVEIDDPSDANKDYLEPEQWNIIYHCIVGSSPSSGKVYMQYPPNVTTRNILGLVDQSSGTNIGYFNGYDSPYERPTKVSEFAVLYGIDAPKFSMYNRESATITGYLRFIIGKYLIKLVTDKSLIQRFWNGAQRVRFITIGQITHLVSAPTWLTQLIEREDLLDVLTED